MSKSTGEILEYFHLAITAFVEKWPEPEPNEKVSVFDCICAYRILLGRNPDFGSELPALFETAKSVGFRAFLESIVSSEEFSHRPGVVSPERLLMAELPDFKFWFNTSDREMGVRMGFGVYEEETIDFFRGAIKRGMVCWDIGAQTGYFTCLFSRLVGSSGAVVAYEPMPSSFDLAVKNIYENGFDDRARIFNSACSNAVGEIPMIVASQMFVVDKNAKDGRKIPCVRLDQEKHPRLPDLIKIDVEGHEPAVLEGLKGVLELSSPTLVLELNEYWLARCSGKAGGAVIRDLNELGYVVYRMEDVASPIDWREFKQGKGENCNVVARRS